MSYPDIITFAPGVTSYSYMHAAKVIIENGICIKDRAGFPGRKATLGECMSCVTVTQAMARQDADQRKAWAEAVVALLTA